MMMRITTIVALLLVAGHAFAHDLPSTRHVLAQVSPDAVRIMITHEEPQNDRTKLLLARFDVNRNNKLDPEEAKLARPTWSQYVLAGLSFEIPGEKPGAREPMVKVEQTERGSIATAILMEFKLPRGTSRTLVARASDKTPTTTKIMVEGQQGLRLLDVNGYPPPQRPMPPVALARGQELRFVLKSASTR